MQLVLARSTNDLGDLYLIIAWRIHTMTMLGRAYPDASCDLVFEPREWQTIYTMQYQSPPPDQPPPLRDTVRALAQLGGFLARTGDGEPGIKAIWQGYQRLHEFIYAVETHLAVNGPEKCIMVSAHPQRQAPNRCRSGSLRTASGAASAEGRLLGVGTLVSERQFVSTPAYCIGSPKFDGRDATNALS